jgi:5-methyltetrahydrofolate--homocysteine methyltransferase
MMDLQALSEAIITGDQIKAVKITKAAIDKGIAARTILNNGLIEGMNIVGDRFKKNEIYIPEVHFAAHAMKSAMEILEPELVKAGVDPIGKLLIGTVQGDQHDIGKNLVAMMLKCSGFEVIDLGIDVSPEKFIEQAKARKVHLIGMSSLLTTTMRYMEETIKALKKADISVKVMIGGAPVTQSYADKIGADGYSPDAASAVDLAKSLIS